MCNGQVVYSQNLSGFVSAVGQHEMFDFDSIAPGTDFSGQTMAGITFTQLGSPLVVVKASDTYTPSNMFSGIVDLSWYKLPATSGQNILSPGGPELGSGALIDQDSLQLQFVVPQSFFGFDHLSQSADGWSFTTIALYDSANTLLYNSGIPISGGLGGPGGADFWGITFGSPVISKVLIQEFDSNTENPDANVGFDTIRYSAVPEPSSLLVLSPFLLRLLRRRK